MPRISDAKILMIATDGFEQSELEFPRDQLRVKGAEVAVASLDGKPIKGWEGDDWGREAEADLALEAVRVEDYDALVLPGGQINPDVLRINDDVIELINGFYDQGKVIAAICHAPWLLIEAGVVKGRTMTSFQSIKTDMINAGADWQDSEVVADAGIVTSRNPDDLKAFVSKIVEEIEEGQHAR
ncbi:MULTISPECIES: type 1 glutamine amidotransferase domain-containing protein [Phaeobacter]|uniref:type 1 glutamine amidotransferase domain-containing protein n=1 Tax=Phaeobacter TaxID=302485 RepID=UPI00058DD609|nr:MULTISPECIES: type 1 glutamine amidotransferase domain-containing protein [Phaeobacter]ATG40741.1 intracellular protease PfpI [Phaeobacter piscinae]KII12973.1 glutamine amidotransferase [Phaeobacter sp. S60]UTS81713.1 Protein/nucleic acid deglycase 2 [Phaeobacter piscinae]